MLKQIFTFYIAMMLAIGTVNTIDIIRAIRIKKALKGRRSTK